MNTSRPPFKLAEATYTASQLEVALDQFAAHIADVVRKQFADIDGKNLEVLTGLERRIADLERKRI